MPGKDADQQKYTKNIYRLEHDVIFHENISSDIDEYKSALKSRLKRLSQWPANSYDDLINILNHIQQTAKPLLANYSSEKNIPLSDFLANLINSLCSLGVLHCYQTDEAG